MVSVGLKPLMLGKVELPITNRFGTSQLWPYLLTTEVFGSLPMRVPPSWCAPGAPGPSGERHTCLAPIAFPISSILRIMNSTRASSFGRRQS